MHFIYYFISFGPGGKFNEVKQLHLKTTSYTFFNYSRSIILLTFYWHSCLKEKKKGFSYAPPPTLSFPSLHWILRFSFQISIKKEAPTGWQMAQGTCVQNAGTFTFLWSLSISCKEDLLRERVLRCTGTCCAPIRKWKNTENLPHEVELGLSSTLSLLYILIILGCTLYRAVTNITSLTVIRVVI